MKEFFIKPIIKFGEASLDTIKNLKGKKVFIVTDKIMISLKLVNTITEILKKSKIDFVIFDEVEPNPTIDIVEKGLKEMIKFEPDTIIAFGGGSPIDACKAILHFDIKLKKELKITYQKPLFLAIPTTSGTGSEVTSYSVISKNHKKIVLSNPEMLPDIAILNPEYMKTLPNFIVADTGIDILTHAVEAYVSLKKNSFSDACSVEAIGILYKHLIEHYEDVKKLKPREKIQEASCLAGIAFNNSSLGINHSIAHSVGGKFGISHGRANGIILPYVMRANMEFNPTIYAEISNKLNLGGNSVEEKCLNLIKFIENLRTKLGIKNSLEEMKINEKEYLDFIPELLRDIKKDICTEFNPRKLNDEEYIKLLVSIYYGKQ
ncbi:MAG: 1-propanol dehydrogenase PduQ [Fusobacteriaceae bacterium]